MSDRRYWIWLQLCLGAARPVNKIIDYFGSIEALYNSNYLQRRCCPELTDSIIDRLESTPLEEADKIISECRSHNWDIITFGDREYPDKLRQISTPPAVLYCDGRLPDLDSYASVGIIGTRKASPYALTVAALMAKGISRCNAIVVSGGALGVDSAAHNGALDANGITIAVLGCGLGTDYLVQNRELRRRIAFNGAVITEYPPYTKASRFTFPARNRIISGLCDGIFIAEAGVKSGSLITARFALEQNRDVFVIPASVLDERFEGTNLLIDDGAVVARSPEKILGCYSEKYNTLDMSRAMSIAQLRDEYYESKNIEPLDDEQITFENIEQHRTAQSDIEAKRLNLKGDLEKAYYVLTDDFSDTGEIATKASLRMSAALMALTALELDGLAETDGSGYRKKRA